MPEAIRKPFNSQAPIEWGNFHHKISQFFTVGEVLQYDHQRRPNDSQTIGSILSMAAELDLIRKDWGSAIGVTSWYRPPAVNRAVRGSQFSQHLLGSAADIYTMDGRDHEFEAWLDSRWGGGLGYGVKSGCGFTHLDLRGGGWIRGSGEIRWEY
jgi:putative chitinase